MSRGRLREIKKKVQATKNLMKITRAMEMVARAKVRKFERAFRAFKEYMKEVERIKESMFSPESDHPLLAGGEGTVIFVFTSDLGLCGAYNSEVVRRAEQEGERTADLKGYVVIGSRGVPHFRKLSLLKSYEKLYDFPTVEVASLLADQVVNLVKGGEAGRIKVVYNEFINALIQRPKVVDLVPVKLSGKNTNFEYEPSTEDMVDSFLYFYLTSKMMEMMFEAKVSEYYARQNAMKNATDNANEMIRTLTLEYNKARQASITQEIIEIVNGAEALKEIEEAG